MEKEKNAKKYITEMRDHVAKQKACARKALVTVLMEDPENESTGRRQLNKQFNCVEMDEDAISEFPEI